MDVLEQLNVRVVGCADAQPMLDISVPALVLQCEYDAIASKSVGRYVHEQIPGSTLQMLDVAGHCPNLSAPQLTAAAIRSFVDQLPPRP